MKDVSLKDYDFLDLISYIKSLDYTEQLLFFLYYIDNLFITEISKILKIEYIGIVIMLLVIENKITENISRNYHYVKAESKNILLHFIKQIQEGRLIS